MVSLRYFNPIGAHESGRIGDCQIKVGIIERRMIAASTMYCYCQSPPLPLQIHTNLMPCIGDVVAGRKDCLKVWGNDYDTPDGTGVRDFIHVMDLARGHVAALKWLNDNDQVGWQACSP